MKPWGWREHIAHWIHRLAFQLCPPQCEDIVIRDADGSEVFSIAFEGGFVASGPCEPYRVYSREYADDDDMVGTETEW